MTKKRRTRRALINSVISLIICFSMLLGTTFAWFTDSVSSVNNIIQAGNLDVELEYWDGDSYEPVANNNLFESDLWEPGHVEYVNLKVKNAGSLALKYQLQAYVYAEQESINQKDETFKLSDHIKFGTISEKFTGTRAQALEKAAQNTVYDVNALDWTTTNTLYPTDNADSKPSESEITLVIWMPETVGNEANHKTSTLNNPIPVPSVTFGINLNATQLTYEDDSFGNDYDEDAVIADEIYVVEEAAEFETTLNAIATATDETVLLQLGTDVEWATGAAIGSTPLVGEDAAVENLIIDGQGKTFTATGSGVGPIRMANGGTLTIKNAKIVDESVSYAEGSWEYGYLEFGGNLVFENVEFVNAAMMESDSVVFRNCTFNSNDDNQYGVWVSDGKAEFYNCTFEGARGLKTHEAYGSEVKSVVVDGCTFKNLTKKPGVAIGTMNADTAITIKNSEFANCQAGDQGLYIYETDTDVSTFTFVEENNRISSYEEVDTVEEFTDAIKTAGSAGAGNSVIELTADLDLTGKAWTPIKVDGYHGADVVKIEGNGNTITGLTAPLFAGGFAGGSGIIIEDLTIADSDIVSTNTIGSGAFIESVDSMSVITLENCHLIDSTVTGGPGSRTGGLIGWTAGYSNVNDGPVKTYVTIEDCSVKGCTITCDGSVGGLYGHAGNNDWTYSTVKNCVVKDNILNSTDDGGWRVGVVVGTANVGELTISNITESGNTLTQTGKTAPAGQSNLYGRFVPGATGKLVIDGVTIN